MLPDDKLNVTPKPQYDGLPSDHSAKPQTTHLNDSTLVAKL